MLSSLVKEDLKCELVSIIYEQVSQAQLLPASLLLKRGLQFQTEKWSESCQEGVSEIPSHEVEQVIQK